MQEHIEDKTVALSTKAARMTYQTLQQMIRAYLRHRQNSKNRKGTKSPKPGQVSERTLRKMGGSLTDVDITGENIGSFKRIAREHNIYFSLKRDDSENPPRWVVSFRGKDDKAIESALKEYARENISRTPKVKKPSLLKRISKIKEHLKKRPEPIKTKKRGGHEL